MEVNKIRKMKIKKKRVFTILLLFFSILGNIGYSVNYETEINFGMQDNNRIQSKIDEKNSVPIPQQGHDNTVYWDGVYHNSREAYYRNPGWGTTSESNKTGAVPFNQEVILRIQTVKDDLETVKIRYWNGLAGIETFLDLTVVDSTNEFDYWEGIIPAPNYPSDFYYSFILSDGTDTDYYQDDLNDGGVGKMYDIFDGDQDWGLVFYDPEFKTPDWHKNAIGYQIFTDRFFNGDTTNDPVGNGIDTGDITWWEWDRDGNNVFTGSDPQRTYTLKQDWGNTPVGGHDFFGGDLKGVQDKRDYLNDLGIKFIWFNPISEGPDNHGYSVDNYTSVDPYFGSIEGRDNGIVTNNASESIRIFDEMVSSLGELGIKVFYDAVINHCSAQSVYFQRFDTSISPFEVSDAYPAVDGAYESTGSPYYDWFQFSTWNHDYDSWWGFDNIPTMIYESAGGEIEQELITGENSLFTFWDDHGIGGFRLDVPNMYRDGEGSKHVNKLIRDKVKENDPDDLIIGEIWGRANAWLTGTMFDGVQNMPFRDRTIEWLKGIGSDSRYSNYLIYPQENYPPEAFYSLWTILGNHDTSRILSSLDEDINKLLLAATIQFTYPGVPMIYYGDEVGLLGIGDPGCRKTYPWDNENIDILGYYKNLTSIRTTYDVFRRGSFQILDDNAEKVIVFGRELIEETNQSAITVFNNIDSEVRINVNVSSLIDTYEGDLYVDLLNGNKTYEITTGNSLSIILPAYKSAILLKTYPDENNNNPLPVYVIVLISGSAISLIMIVIIGLKKFKNK
jgi:glycosidase